jgi:RecB family exonuclease
MGADGKGGVRFVRGARRAEACLRAEVERLRWQSAADVALLARPVRIVVPSRSLRAHLAVSLAREPDGAPGALAGFALQTLASLARDVLRRCGEPTRAGDLLFPVVVREEARREPALHAAFEALSEGYGAVAASVADLLDAGMLEAHEGPLEECLEAAPVPERERERARAIVRVAGRCARRLGELGAPHRSALLRRAAELLARGVDVALPARAVLVHGFADATGVAADLLEALVRYAGATIWIDHPPDPVDALALAAGLAPAGGPAPGVDHTSRLVERLVSAGGGSARDSAPGPAPRIELGVAPGAAAEHRAVAVRVGALLDADAVPERIGIVARELGPVAGSLRVELDRRAVPYSAPPGEPSPAGPAERQAQLLLELLRSRDAMRAERWLELYRPQATRLRPDLRLALHARGVVRLRDVARAPWEEWLAGAADLALPVRYGLAVAPEPAEAVESEEDDAGSVRATAPRRRLARETLAEAVAAAERLCDRLTRWPARAELSRHLAELRRLLAEDLGWRRDDSPEGRILARVADVGIELPAELSVDRADLAVFVEQALREPLAAPLGGAGGGVQVLGVTAARGRTFEHLFVVGLNREVFPRGVSEDALLPDALRAPLRQLLPDLPRKRAGVEEERYLFASLLASAREVHLSWQSADDEGATRSPSPLVARLLAVAGAPAIADLAAHAAAPAAGGRSGPRPAHEHAVLRGLARDRAGFEAALAAALEDGSEGACPSLAARLAGVRVRVVAELESRRGGLGPYFGMLGRVREDADPRNTPLYVTTLERLASCPWQAFLERLLRLEPAPDALEALPAVDPFVLGLVVHRVLERVDRGAGDAVATLASAIARGARPVEWPSLEELEGVLREEAERVLSEEGVAFPGFARIVAERARPRLEQARAQDAERSPRVFGSEVEASFEVADTAGRARALLCRIDRVESAEEGRLRLVDWKTGKPVAGAQSRWRKDHLLERIRKGRWLQLPAYVRTHPTVERAELRYLGSEVEPDAARVVLEASRPDARQAFDRTLRALIAALDLGAFVPRLAETGGGEPRPCARCRVREACSRGSANARRRLVDFSAAAAPPAGAERAAWEVLGLGAEQEGPAPEAAP